MKKLIEIDVRYDCDAKGFDDACPLAPISCPDGDGFPEGCPLPDATETPCEHVDKSVVHTREGWCLVGRSADSHTAFYVDMTHCPFCGAKLPEVQTC